MPLPTEITLWIDPVKVTRYVGTRYPRPIAPKRHLPPGAFVVQLLAYLRYSRLFNANWDRRTELIDELPKYLKVKDLVAHLDDFRNSRWYSEWVEALRRQGEVRHKKIRMTSIDDLDHFFENYACDMIRSLRDHGYLPERGSRLGGAAIARSGELLKTNAGDHRFFAARYLNVKPVPLQIRYIHPRWLKQHDLSLAADDADRLTTALRQVEQAYQ